MCGIAGLIGPILPAAREAAAKMIAACHHRGPDDGGLETHMFGDQTLALAHRRLSIIDLSPAGHQPMTHPQTGDQIIFNGEAYNFAELRKELEAAGSRFIGHSDTEVMLHALSLWGESAIRRFQGMFAFAFFDKRNTRLILARDSVGIKPLYVAQSQGHFLFASEVRGILASGLIDARLDRAGLAGLLAYGSVQHPLTLFEGIHSFPPGHYQIITPAGAAEPVAFWDYPPPRETSEARAIEQMRHLFDAAVKDHLVADVPVGVFLSSGLDSTIVAALAARHTPNLRSFTVAFADQPDLSEGTLAAQSAKSFGLQHTEIQITGADAEQACLQWLDALDQPSLDGLNVYVISKAIRAHGIVVALAGNGGDELFGGYPSFVDVPRLRRAMRKIAWMPRTMRRGVGNLMALRKPLAVRQKLADMAGGDASLLELYLQRRRAMSNAQLAELGLTAAEVGLAANFQPPRALRDVRIDDADPFGTISQLETRFYQANTLLRDSDANGMAHSLEIRVPLLDQRILDFAFALPGQIRLPQPISNKHLMRRAFADIYSPEIAKQKKMGFTLPIRRWMLGPFRDICESAIQWLHKSGTLRREGVESVWRAFIAEPESAIWSRALTLCVLGHFLRKTKTSD